ncbi:unnamed protein product, partial [Ectocarpus sp. 12 AP-2014]
MNGIVDATGRTPLHHACMNDCPEAIVSMLRHGARVDAKDDDGDTPLHVASNVNAPADSADGSAALSLATLNDCNADGIMKVLIQHGADVNGKNKEGFTALHRAAMYNDIDCIDVLISAGAIIEATDIHKSTPLAVAFRSAVHRGKEDNSVAGEFAAMIALLKHGADPNIGNIEKACPNSLLYYFVRCGCPIPVFRELLAAGPNLDVRADDGYTPLMVSQDHPDLFSELLLHGADTNAQTKRGETALHKAAESNSSVCIEALISAGASTNVKDNDGCTPLHLATICRNRSVMRMLLRSGADI